MGLIENDNDGGYVLYDNGENAIAKPKEIDSKLPSTNGQFESGYQLHIEFDSVNERDDSESGVLPAWLNSKITIAETDDHTSDLAKLLRSAGVLEDTVSELVAGNEAAIEKVVSGKARYEVESEEENLELMKAVSKSISDRVFRVGTKQNKNGEYSKVDDVYGAADRDPFSSEEFEESEEESDESAEEGVLFDEGDEPETEDGDEFVEA